MPPLWVCSILTFFGIADYIETLPIGQIILCSILVVVFIHLFIYMHSSRRKSDRLLLLGLLAAIICISIEAISVYFVTSISGLFIGIGMIILLFVNSFILSFVSIINKERKEIR